MGSRKEPAIGWVAVATLVALLAACGRPAAAEPSRGEAAPAARQQSRGMAAVEAAAKSHKYLFIFFWKENDENARSMYGVFQSAMGKWAKSADSIGVQITDPNEKPVVDKFGVSRAPMPLVVALAPNGAVTKGFPVKFTEEQLQQAFVSPCTARCLKAMQDRKLVLLCVQNQSTQSNQAAAKGVQDFKADPRFGQATEVVHLNPSDGAETTLLKGLQVDPRTSTAVTVLLAPPGGPIAKFTGAVTKEQIVAKVASAQSGPCANGQCGPGGCGPKK